MNGFKLRLLSSVLVAGSSAGLAQDARFSPATRPQSDVNCDFNNSTNRRYPNFCSGTVDGTRTGAPVGPVTYDASTGRASGEYQVSFSGNLQTDGVPISNSQYGFVGDASNFVYDDGTGTVKVNADTSYIGRINNAPTPPSYDPASVPSYFNQYSFQSTNANSIEVNIKGYYENEDEASYDGSYESYRYLLTSPNPTAVSGNSTALTGTYSGEDRYAVVFGTLSGSAQLVAQQGTTPAPYGEGGYYSPFRLQFNVTPQETTRLDANGLTTPTVSVTNGINMNGSRITNLAAGSAPGDAVNRAQLDAVAAQRGTDSEARDAAVNAQSTANAALNNAAIAQATGETAQRTANTAIANAARAQSTADAALTSAARAQSTADTALTNAARAQSTADTALSNAATAQATADTAVTNAARAQGTADTARAEAGRAQATADAGVRNAARAQTTADTAVADAARAQGTADTGVRNAARAQSTADTALARSTYYENSYAGARPVASGSQSLAIGSGTTASGNSSVAIGHGAQARNGAAVSIGMGNVASGNGAVAIGDPNLATGTGAVALGNNNTATGTGAVAIGNESTANGTSAVALGNRASANAANSVAIGDGASATRTGQVALGTTASTYTAAGLGSAASSAAQSGPTRFVTGDAGGNLAYSSFGPADLASLTSRMGTAEGQIVGLQQDVRRANAGIAAAMAIGGTMMPPGTSVAMSFNLATFAGQQGFSASGVARVTDRVWVNAGVAGSSVKGSTGGRAGFTVGW